MKKAILVMVVFAAVGFTSCKKCVTCDYGVAGVPDSELCTSDGDARDLFESTCKAGGGAVK